MAGKYSIYKYVKLAGKGWRYARAVYHPNGKIKPDAVLVKDVNGKNVEEKHPEGSYFLNFNNTWIPVRGDAREAQHQRKLKLNQVEYERLSGKTAAPGPNLVQLGRKVIKDEVDAYLADLELAKRPHKTIQSKRRFLTSFMEIVPKKFTDQFNRNDVLTFRNKLMSEYDPKSVNTMMMCVVTFFNRHLKIKLGMEASDWPEYNENDPEPYLDEEIVAMEKVSTGIPNLLVRLFRSVGCREMEIAHLNDTDINVRTKEIMIRQKPCSHCKDCISEGNVWKPKTKAGTRNIPVSDSILAELLALPKGKPPQGCDATLLFPNGDGNVNGHLLRKVQRGVKGSGVAHVKLHRFRDTFITNKLRDGVDIRTVQRWAGHDDINVTMSYAAWLDAQSEAARNAANREDTRYKTGTNGD
jgi:integrase